MSHHRTRYSLLEARSAFTLRTFVSQSEQFAPKEEKNPDICEVGPTKEMWAAIEPTELTVFHNPDDPMSVRVVRALQAAVIEFLAKPGNDKLGKNSRRIPQYFGPLKLDVIVYERALTADEFRLLLPLQPLPYFTAFLNPTKLSQLRETPTSAPALVELIAQRPELLYWPVVVEAEPPPPPPAPPPAEWIDYD
ncbi:hypothetical protein K438DRAFT_1977469 [Mycena galopus ATCC 62051]|nr:hypothetical protein K438DRAFT_1977469 [Mycena galopus ATCC 62051]